MFFLLLFFCSGDRAEQRVHNLVFLTLFLLLHIKIILSKNQISCKTYRVKMVRGSDLHFGEYREEYGVLIILKL